MSSFDDPLFRVYAISAASMAILMASQAWITVYRMTKVKGGFRSPEDVKRSPLNPNPSPEQVQPNEYVERSRRMHDNHTENIPLFLVVGLLFVLAQPPLWAAQLALYGYVVTRILHFAAYMTAQLHDVRAAMWTPGALAVMAMAIYVLVSAI
ncbi:MAG: MAPEG family protein [Kofleriaceae bacterium]|nr:MAG: MAPEG family protein [Kofleriaceae bacterium]MBZ0233315.1 MAPEG family protein [Kofleriaceae bacterium]